MDTQVTMNLPCWHSASHVLLTDFCGCCTRLRNTCADVSPKHKSSLLHTWIISSLLAKLFTLLFEQNLPLGITGAVFDAWWVCLCWGKQYKKLTKSAHNEAMGTMSRHKNFLKVALCLIFWWWCRFLCADSQKIRFEYCYWTHRSCTSGSNPNIIQINY